MNVSASDLRKQLARLEPGVRNAFITFVQDIVSRVRVSDLERLVSTGAVADIAALLRVSASELSQILEEIRAAYLSAGSSGAANIPPPPGIRARFQFDIRNSRAEAWLRDRSSQFVTRIGAHQLAAIRAALETGAAAGANPRRTALDIVGRMGPTGRRVGGVIGLTGPQAQYVLNARRQLLSGDPTQMSAYFERVMRDRRFDGIVRRAIAAGRPVSPADAQRMIDRYSDRLLKLRGDTIARTETLAAFNSARDEAMRQALDTGSIVISQVVTIWRSASDGRVRDAHSSLNGARVPFGQPFVSPTGSSLRFPGDGSLGAGASDLANCRCVSENKVDYLRGVR